MERLEELAARYVLGLLDKPELAELETRLASSPEERAFFAEFCMDEVLLSEVLAPGPAAARAAQPASAVPAPGLRRGLAAAALLLAFLAGWNVARVVPPGHDPGSLDGSAGGPAREEQSARLSPAEEPLPIYYPVTDASASVRLVVHPLDFDESGALSTNPYLEYVPLGATEL